MIENDIEEIVLKIVQWQRWDNPNDWGLAYWISPMDVDAIPDILIQLELAKKRLIQIYDREKKITEEERYESYNES